MIHEFRRGVELVFLFNGVAWNLVVWPHAFVGVQHRNAQQKNKGRFQEHTTISNQTRVNFRGLPLSIMTPCSFAVLYCCVSRYRLSPSPNVEAEEDAVEAQTRDPCTC